MIKQLLVISFTHEFVFEHVNPSLIDYHLVLKFKLCHPVLIPKAQLSTMSKAYVNLPCHIISP